MYISPSIRPRRCQARYQSELRGLLVNSGERGCCFYSESAEIPAAAHHVRSSRHRLAHGVDGRVHWHKGRVSPVVEVAGVRNLEQEEYTAGLIAAGQEALRERDVSTTLFQGKARGRDGRPRRTVISLS